MKVLNLLLHKLTGRPVDAAELAFLAVDEQLVDIGDDLFDYEVNVEQAVPHYAMPCRNLWGTSAFFVLPAQHVVC